MVHDVIVLGGGHNGLTAAGLLARRGRKVLVLERRPAPGGLAGGEEFHPGFRSPGVLHDTACLRRSVIEKLELTRFGLHLRAERTPVFAPQEDGRGMLLHADPQRTRDELRRHSAHDAEHYVGFCEFLRALTPFVSAQLDAPAPLIAPSRAGEFVDLFRRGLALRRLGRELVYDCLRLGPMSAADWLGEHFEDGLLKATLAAPALLGTWSGPHSAGTATLILMRECTAAAEVAGGSAALVDALTEACQAAGVELRTGAEVARIDVVAGRVHGVTLADGEEIAARAVASSLDPRRTLLDLVPPRDLPPGLEAPLRAWRCRGTTAKVDLALDAPLEFAGRPGELFESVRICADLDELERAFDPVKYRALPEVPHLDVLVPTLADPSLAPAGQHVASVLVHFVTRDLDGGWNDAARALLLERTIDRLRRVAPTCVDRIVGHRVLTPEDLEREYGTTGGHVHHGEHGLDQMFSLRPTASCARYATPLQGLYLCGSGSHPGGGITGAPGMLAAAAM